MGDYLKKQIVLWHLGSFLNTQFSLVRKLHIDVFFLSPPPLFSFSLSLPCYLYNIPDITHVITLVGFDCMTSDMLKQKGLSAKIR